MFPFSCLPATLSLCQYDRILKCFQVYKKVLAKVKSTGVRISPFAIIFRITTSRGKRLHFCFAKISTGKHAPLTSFPLQCIMIFFNCVIRHAELNKLHNHMYEQTESYLRRRIFCFCAGIVKSQPTCVGEVFASTQVSPSRDLPAQEKFLLARRYHRAGTYLRRRSFCLYTGIVRPQPTCAGEDFALTQVQRSQNCYFVKSLDNKLANPVFFYDAGNIIQFLGHVRAENFSTHDIFALFCHVRAKILPPHDISSHFCHVRAENFPTHDIFAFFSHVRGKNLPTHDIFAFLSHVRAKNLLPHEIFTLFCHVRGKFLPTHDIFPFLAHVGRYHCFETYLNGS